MLPTVLWLALFFICNWLFLYIIRGINKNIFLLKSFDLVINLNCLNYFCYFPACGRMVSNWVLKQHQKLLLSVAVIVLLIMEIKNSVLISKHENRIKTLLQNYYHEI